MFDVCVVGSANLDLVATTPHLPAPGQTVLGTTFAEHPGGKGLNQAVAAARSGAHTAFVGAVGRDAAGDRLQAELEAAGIDVAGLAHVDGPTGRALIAVDGQGENSIVVVPGANALVGAGPLPPARVVLVQLEIPVDVVATVLAAAHVGGSTTVLNPAPADGWRSGLAADVVVPNEGEAAHVGGVAALLAGGAGAVVTTKGVVGVSVTTAQQTWDQPAMAVDVVDTTGAGDAFCGALAARLAAGDDLGAAVRWATAAGALATTRAGAVPAMPDHGEIAALLDSQ